MHFILIAGSYFAFKNKKHIATLLIILLFLIPIFNFKSGSMGYRQFFNAFCLMFILLPPILKLKKTPAITTVIALIILPFSILSYNSNLFDPPVNMYKSLANEAINSINSNTQISDSNKPVLIIAHKGIKEQIILQSDYDALNWIPDSYIDSINYYRIVSGITDYEIIKYSGNSQSGWIKLQSGYYISKEDIWQNFMQALNEEGEYTRIKELETWLNPYSKRPQFLR